jgi:hypothetical protein
MKKATLYLLMISLIGMLEVPVHAADVYADESTELYSFDEGAMCDDDFATECQADVSDKKLQQDFESAMKDGIGLGLDDFFQKGGHVPRQGDGSTQSDSEAEVLEADFEAAMQDDNIKLSEAGIESMNLISTNDDNIDAEYAAEINEWESKPILTRAASTVSRVEYGQQWRIYRKSDNATMVQWVLRGLFLYNG